MKSLIIKCIILVFFFISFNYSDSTYVVITNKSLEKNSIEKIQLKRIYMGKVKVWNSGESIKPVDLDRENELRYKFSMDILNKSPKQMERIYLKKALEGKWESPVKFNEFEEVISWVKNNKGSIAYIPANLVDKSIKVLQIE